jgi:hypothetical protein
MRESCSEGVATHTGPESCVVVRKGGGEALTGERAGPVDEDHFPLGLIHAALGETDRAFSAFGGARRWESPATELIRYCFPDVLGPLRRDPRYEELLRELDRSWNSKATPGR